MRFKDFIDHTLNSFALYEIQNILPTRRCRCQFGNIRNRYEPMNSVPVGQRVLLCLDPMYRGLLILYPTFSILCSTD